MTNKIEVDFIDNSEAVMKDFETAIFNAAMRCGNQAAGYAIDLCPVVSGYLQNSITYAVSGMSAVKPRYSDNSGVKHGAYSGTIPPESGGALSVYVGSNTPYAVPVEVGTARRKATPFIKPAVADHAQTYRNIIENEMKKG